MKDQNIEFVVSPERIRQLSSGAKHSQATTEEARAFMLLYRTQLQDALSDAVKKFVQTKMASER